MDYQEIIKKAFDAAKYSYSPYSNFKVGACVEMNDGVYFLELILKMLHMVQRCAQKEMQCMGHIVMGIQSLISNN